MENVGALAAFGFSCVVAVTMAATAGTRLTRHAKRAATMPPRDTAFAVVLLAAGVVSLFILAGLVVPAVSEMLARLNSALPASTRLVIVCCQFLQRFWLVALPMLACPIGGLAALRYVPTDNRNAVRAADGLVTGALGVGFLALTFVMWGMFSPLVGMITRLS